MRLSSPLIMFLASTLVISRDLRPELRCERRATMRPRQNTGTESFELSEATTITSSVVTPIAATSIRPSVTMDTTEGDSSYSTTSSLPASSLVNFECAIVFLFLQVEKTSSNFTLSDELPTIATTSASEPVGTTPIITNSGPETISLEPQSIPLTTKSDTESTPTIIPTITPTSTPSITSTAAPKPEQTVTITRMSKTTSTIWNIITKKLTVTDTSRVDVTSTIFLTDTVTESNVATATEWVFETKKETISLARRTIKYSQPTSTASTRTAIPYLPLVAVRRAVVTTIRLETVLITSTSTFFQTDKIIEPMTNVVTATKRQIKTIFENAEATVTSTSIITLTSTLVGIKTETGTETATIATIDSTTTTETVSSTPESFGSDNKGLSTGAKAGIGAGAGIVVLLVIAGIIVYFRQKCRRPFARAPTWDPGSEYHQNIEPKLPIVPQDRSSVAYVSNNQSPSNYPASPTKTLVTPARLENATTLSFAAQARDRNTVRKSVPLSEMSGDTLAASQNRHVSHASELDHGQGLGNTQNQEPYGRGRSNNQEANELDGVLYRLGQPIESYASPYSDVPPPLTTTQRQISAPLEWEPSHEAWQHGDLASQRHEAP